jgi:hypothetical protein
MNNTFEELDGSDEKAKVQYMQHAPMRDDRQFN